MNTLKIKHLLDMKNIQRFSHTPHLQGYNLLEHGFVVGFLFRWIASEEDVPYDITVWEKVLLHDIVETVTGDLCYLVKNFNNTTADAWDVIEKEVVKSDTTLAAYTDAALKNSMTERQFRLFKVCDYLDLFLFCHKEIQMGNASKGVMATMDNCERIIRTITTDFTIFPIVHKIMQQAVANIFD